MAVRRSSGALGAPDNGRRPHPRVRRLLTIGVLVVAGLLTGQSLVSPLALGWRRAEELAALEDHQFALAGEERELRADIEYRKTEGGQKLAALEAMRATDPGARAIELVAAEPEPINEADVPLPERMAEWRREGRAAVYAKWRVLSLYLFDRRLPATPPDPGQQ